MGDTGINKSERIVRGTVFLVCFVFAVVTLIKTLVGTRSESILVAAATVMLVFAPWLAERLFHRRLGTGLYLFCMFYAIGPMLGVCYNFYYRISWWDKMLHIFGGLAFALFGIYLFELLGGKGKRKRLITALFALCFSISVSAVWEFAEFGADQFLGMDMQSDRIVHSIRSYSIGTGVGITGIIEQIHTVSVNGKLLPINGYLDIGLMDTMLDMLLESGGALAVSLLYLADRGKHFELRREKEESG